MNIWELLITHFDGCEKLKRLFSGETRILSTIRLAPSSIRLPDSSVNAAWASVFTDLILKGRSNTLELARL